MVRNFFELVPGDVVRSSNLSYLGENTFVGLRDVEEIDGEICAHVQFETPDGFAWELFTDSEYGFMLAN